MSLHVEPVSLSCVCMSSGYGIHEVSRAVDILMNEAVVGKGQVGLPSICDDEGARTNMSFDLRYGDVVVAVIVLTLCHESLVAPSSNTS